MVATRAWHSPSVSPPRPGEFQALAVEEREASGKLVGLGKEFGVLQDRHAFVGDLGLAPVLAESGGGQEIFEGGETFERLRDLEAAADPHADPVHRGGMGHVAAKKGDGPGIGKEVAGDQIEEGGFACAVRADDAERLTLRYRKRHAFGHLEGAEAF